MTSVLQRANDGNHACAIPEAPVVNIWCATKHGNMEMVKKHLANKVDIDAPDPHNGLTPLTWASITGNTEIATYLLKAGARINSKNRDSGTPLHEAAFTGQDEIVELLLQNGADVEALDDDGKTPLHRVRDSWEQVHVKFGEWQFVVDVREVYRGRIAIAELLVQHEETDDTPKSKDHVTATVKGYENKRCVANADNKTDYPSCLAFVVSLLADTYLCFVCQGFY